MAVSLLFIVGDQFGRNFVKFCMVGDMDLLKTLDRDQNNIDLMYIYLNIGSKLKCCVYLR